jgi:hypothetical protein
MRTFGFVVALSIALAGTAAALYAWEQRWAAERAHLASLAELRGQLVAQEEAFAERLSELQRLHEKDTAALEARIAAAENRAGSAEDRAAALEINAVRTVVARLELVASTPREAVEKLRRFISENAGNGRNISLVAGADWHRRYAFYPELVIPLLMAAAETGDDAHKPYVDCGPATLVMLAVLRELGLPARMVHVFDDAHDQIRSHTFVEVNLDGRWEAHDPLYNLHYENDEGTVLSVEEVILAGGESVVACTDSFCGWSHPAVREYAFVRDYLGLAMVFDETVANPGIVWNPELFDMEKNLSR